MSKKSPDLSIVKFDLYHLIKLHGPQTTVALAERMGASTITIGNAIRAGSTMFRIQEKEKQKIVSVCC